MEMTLLTDGKRGRATISKVDSEEKKEQIGGQNEVQPTCTASLTAKKKTAGEHTVPFPY